MYTMWNMICEWELIRAGAAVLTPPLYHSIPYSIECENKMWEKYYGRPANCMCILALQPLTVIFKACYYIFWVLTGVRYSYYTQVPKKVTQIDIFFLKLCMQLDLKHIFSKKSCVQIEFSETSTLFSKMQVNSKTYPFEFLFRLKWHLVTLFCLMNRHRILKNRVPERLADFDALLSTLYCKQNIIILFGV